MRSKLLSVQFPVFRNSCAPSPLTTKIAKSKKMKIASANRAAMSHAMLLAASVATTSQKLSELVMLVVEIAMAPAYKPLASDLAGSVATTSPKSKESDPFAADTSDAAA